MPITTILTKHGKVGGASGGEVPLTAIFVICLLFNNLGEGRGTEFCLLLSNLEEGRGTNLGEGAALSRSFVGIGSELGEGEEYMKEGPANNSLSSWPSKWFAFSVGSGTSDLRCGMMYFAFTGIAREIETLAYQQRKEENKMMDCKHRGCFNYI